MKRYSLFLTLGLVFLVTVSLVISVFREIDGPRMPATPTSTPLPIATPLPTVIPSPTMVPTKAPVTPTPEDRQISPTLATEIPSLQGLPTGSATVGVGSVRLFPEQRDTVPVHMRLEDPGGLGGYDLLISFEPAVVRVVSITGGEAPFYDTPIHRIDNENGWVSMVGFQGQQIPGPSGEIVIAHIELEGVGNFGRSSPLKLTVRGLINASDGDPIPAEAVDGSVTIG